MKADPGLAVNDCALDLCHEVLTALGAPLTGTEDMEELRRLLQQGNMQVRPTTDVLLHMYCI